jgi:hypothetical protein
MQIRQLIQTPALLAALGAALFVGIACPGGGDTDGDGFTEGEGDCAPEDATIYPGATEIEDGKDNDCNGAIDDISVGDDDDTGDDDDSTAAVDPGDMDTSVAVTGDWSCKADMVVPPAGVTGDFTGTVLDFEDDVPVDGADVRIWVGNNPQSGAAQSELFTSDANGVVQIDGLIQGCSQFAVYVFKEWNPPITYPTYQINFVTDATPPWTDDLNSVSFSTYNLLPLTVGVEAEPGKGIAAGRVRDCNGDEVANGEASVGTINWDTGAIVEAEGYSMRYFIDDSPNLNANEISPDGLFGALNVPPGEAWSILLWGIPQAEAHCETTTGGDVIWNTENSALCLLSTTGVFVIENSVNTSNINLKPFADNCYAAGDDDDSAGDDDDSAGG